jgi:phosphotransferase system enzyme I (PtsI)
VAYLYEPLHPAILRALRQVCAEGEKAGIEVAMCGEMAGEPLYTLVLLGLGFRELSMNGPSIPRVKRILRQVRREDGVRLVETLLQMPTAHEISQFLENEMIARFPAVFGAPLL